MSLIDKFMGPDTDLSNLIRELFERLPDTRAGSDGLDPGLWDQALLDPARDILGRSGKGLRALLLERCWVLAGGHGDGPPEILPISIELLQAGSLIIDDIEDDSLTRRGEPALHRRYGVPIALNTGNWFCFLPLALLSRVELDDDLRLALYQDMSVALLRCHKGQALDLSFKIGTVAQRDIPSIVAQSTRLKTGSLMELAAVMGARAAGASQTQVTAFARFGGDLGVGLQMLDDWSGIHIRARRDKGVEDITLGRPTWPLAWLARDLDENAFSKIADRAQNVVSKEEAKSLVEQIAASLGSTPAKRIRSHLGNTFDELREALGDSRDFTPLMEDVKKLERAYG